jgi:hypothetical protein
VYETRLPTLAESFKLDAKARNLAKKTIEFYDSLLNAFVEWCAAMAVISVDQLTPETMRLYLVKLSEDGKSDGGVHAVYRTLRAFLNWYQAEYEPAAWRNPLQNVKPPKVGIEPLTPVSPRWRDARPQCSGCGYKRRSTDSREQKPQATHGLFGAGIQTGIAHLFEKADG